MPDMLQRCSLCAAHCLRCVGAARRCLPVGLGVFALVQELPPSTAIIVVAVLAGTRIGHCWWWVLDFVQGLCACGVVVEIVVVHSGSLPLDNGQWMEQPQLLAVSVVTIVTIHTLVPPAILQS